LSNIEIANITSENVQVEISLEDSFPIVIRPGKSITVKVIVSAILKGTYKAKRFYCLTPFIEPTKSIIVIKLKSGYKLLYLVKFFGIDNNFGIKPLVVDKPRKSPNNIINFVMKNEEEEEIEFMISDVSSMSDTLVLIFIVLRETTKITLLYLTRNLKEPDSEYE